MPYLAMALPIIFVFMVGFYLGLLLGKDIGWLEGYIKASPKVKVKIEEVED